MGNNRKFKNSQKLTEHYNKHVLGIRKKHKKESFDKHIEDEKYDKFIKFEKELWELELHGICTEENYLKVANENTDEGNYKRHYTYWSIQKNHRDKSLIKTKSSNYQRGEVYYSDGMPLKDRLGLLTTCLNVEESIITSCFFRTMSYNNIELLTMAISIYYCSLNNKFIEKKDSGISIPGFSLNTFSKELRDVFDGLYEESYHDVWMKYNKRLATKKILVDFLLKTHNSPLGLEQIYEDLFNAFYERFKLEKSNEDLIRKIRDVDIRKYKDEYPDTELNGCRIGEMEIDEIGDALFNCHNSYYNDNGYDCCICGLIADICTLKKEDYAKD